MKKKAIADAEAVKASFERMKVISPCKVPEDYGILDVLKVWQGYPQ